MNQMYNEEIKWKFINEQYPSEESQTTVKYIFYYSYLIEKALNKDLFDFSQEEVGQVLANSNPKSLNVAMSRGSLISKYIEWAIDPNVNLRKDNIHPLRTVDDTWYAQFVDNSLKQFISKTELDEIVSQLVNYQDKIIPVLLFNGVYGTESSEIRNIRYEDVKNMKENKLRLYDDEKGERYITLDDYVVDLLLKAYAETEYLNKNGTVSGRAEKSPLADSEFVVKSLKRGRAIAGQRVSQITIINRTSMIAEQFELPDLTPKSISRSGMLYEASKLIGDKEELTQEDFQVLGEKFNLTKIKTPEYEYYNVTYLKGFINRDNIEKLYGNK